jgi:HlyD family secretion protein
VDRPLDVAFLKHRTHRRVLVGGAVLSLTSAVFAWGPGLVRPTLRRDRIRTARVTRGPIEASISASGTVVPEVEQVISSPVEARVMRILKRAGSAVAQGDAIVELDLSGSRLAVETLDQNLALKRNQQARTRLDLEAKLIAFDGQRKVKALSLSSLQAQYQRKQQLFTQGLLSEEERHQAQVASAQAEIELRQVEDEAANARQSTRAQVEGLDLETATLRKERAEAARQLSLATARADRSGVVTWTVTEEGASMRKGDALARIADLRSFRVDATVSDIHARALAVGLPVVVKAGADSLSGIVSNVLPTIQNGVMTFSVALAEKSSPVLRSNLRVDVLVVTGRRQSALTVRKGPAVEGEATQAVFVVRGDRARRTAVRMGLSGFESCEVLDGLAEGDEVVLSDMTEYMHLSEVRIR